jgi:hypothetical protein
MAGAGVRLLVIIRTVATAAMAIKPINSSDISHRLENGLLPLLRPLVTTPVVVVVDVVAGLEVVL